MRNLKLRAWDIKNTKMLYPDGVYGPYQEPNTKLICLLVADAINGEWGGDELTEDYILMQYVGLEDKNKKEIYVGDRMKIQLPLGGFWGDVTQEKVGIVVFEPEHGGFIIEWEYSRNQHHIEMDCDIAFSGEVIGHVYESN